MNPTFDKVEPLKREKARKSAKFADIPIFYYIWSASSQDAWFQDPYTIYVRYFEIPTIFAQGRTPWGKVRLDCLSKRKMYHGPGPPVQIDFCFPAEPLVKFNVNKTLLRKNYRTLNSTIEYWFLTLLLITFIEIILLPVYMNKFTLPQDSMTPP